MWIKICANTNLEDAQLAAELGADAVGFVFAPSKRQVTASDVSRITLHLPQHVERVGVFNSQNADEIEGIATDAGLSAIQLHGDVDAALATELNERFEGRITLIQTVHWQVDDDGTSAARIGRQIRDIEAADMTQRVLVDSKLGQAGGGTGVAFNWEEARSVFAARDCGLKFIVAGGLRPENVREAIVRLNPWGVDVASGVEARPGQKDPTRLEAFIKNVRGSGQINS